MIGSRRTAAEGRLKLDHLGPRICILGPSNAGKSTLAAAIARSRGLEAVHLDQLYHQPDTDWVPRPRDAFVLLHDAAIAGDRWVVDGNYSLCLPQRLARATGVILLDVSTATSLARYVRRTLFERHRIGALEGGRDSVKWDMIHHIAVTSRANRRRYAAMYEQIDRPKIRLASALEVTRFYRREGLLR